MCALGMDSKTFSVAVNDVRVDVMCVCVRVRMRYIDYSFMASGFCNFFLKNLFGG